MQIRRDPQSVDWADEQQQLTQAVLPFYDETLGAAAQAGMRALPIGVDWDQVNTAVLRLAQAEAQRFAAQAIDTSRTQVSQVVADWIGSGGDMADLIERVSRVWSGPRADVAAVTEVTRIYAQGNATAWRESGVVNALTWKTAEDDAVCPICGPLADTELPFDGELPPAHPNCRCWVVPVVKKPEEL